MECIYAHELSEGDTLQLNGQIYTVLAAYRYQSVPDKVSLQLRTPSGGIIDIEVDAASTLIVNEE